MGVKPHYKGFEYLARAIEIYEPGMKLMEVYKQVAKENKALSATSVERSIRHSKEEMITQNIQETLKDYFGVSVVVSENIKNGEFIALMKFAIEALEGQKNRPNPRQ